LRAIGVVILILGATIGGVALHRWYTRVPRLTGTVQASVERSRRLMGLAAQEAALIKDVDARLTRLLNLAEVQINRNWKEDARATLGSASTTLGGPDAKQLNDHAHLSGWVSVSELSRAADDNPAAVLACEAAVKSMENLEDPAKRCQYVMGVANELQYLKGKPAAAALLDKSGPWTAAIDNVTERRRAIVSFAGALFNLDDYAAGQRMLQKEDDATWRSEVLTTLANTAGEGNYIPSAANLRLISSPSADVRAQETMEVSPTQPYFGRQLGYKQVFQNNLKSATVVDRPTSRPPEKVEGR
jgi:hypothetical protein